MMKRMKLIVMVTALVLLGSGFALALEPEASIEKGMALFNYNNLGTSGKSCATCHPDGQGLEMAGDKENLPGIINSCVTGPLKGQALDTKSDEMQSMVLYIKSLADD
jgi:cytochrome c